MLAKTTFLVGVAYLAHGLEAAAPAPEIVIDTEEIYGLAASHEGHAVAPKPGHLPAVRGHSKIKYVGDVDDVAQAKRTEVMERTEDILEGAKERLLEEYREYLDAHFVLDVLNDPEELGRVVRGHARTVKKEVKRQATEYVRDIERRIKDAVNHFIDRLEARIIVALPAVDDRIPEARARSIAAVNAFRANLLRGVTRFFDELSVLDALSNPEEAVSAMRQNIDQGVDMFFGAHPLLARFRNPGELEAEIEDGIANAKTEVELKLEAAIMHIMDTKNAVEDAVDAKLDEVKETLSGFQGNVEPSEFQAWALKRAINQKIEDAIKEVKEQVTDGDSVIENEILMIVEVSKSEIQTRLTDIFEEYPLADVFGSPQEFIDMLKADLRQYVDDLIDRFPAIEIGVKVLREGKDSLTTKEKLQLSKAVAMILATQSAQN